ncbi:S46 family peptidase [Bacteroidales bacterium OttesenSCG-928-B11]|nr:S46 family peptidase [Bacteroidales bacterium OttesenSCG-928-B11]MDL2325781.1 S46 family peptidase [Bacteroidales bacterium OttesenSCG-928-A14]
MIKKLSLFVAIFFLLFNAKADEGMWLPYLLNRQNVESMEALGCKLTPEEIFSFNKSSIKDAIVQFGRGCTGEIISAEGLLLTNHHCGLSQVQSHATPEKDYLTDGFWAYSKAEELPNPDLTVSFLIAVQDVTDIILKNVKDNMILKNREETIQKAIESLKKSPPKESYQRIDIVPFYHGNQYIMFTYDVYSDVRLVGCPPWGIGKYGADTDNWTWPRHKGDFCLFRVYTDVNGKPAAYSKNNIPLKPKHFLPISLKGVKEGDFAMILGYPGSTDRYMPSQGVEMIINETGPAIVKCRSEKLAVYRKHMDADPAVFIKYASKQASVSNYWKYYIGQVKQLQRNKVTEKKQEVEKGFTNWVNTDPARKNKYGNVLSEYESQYKQLRKYEKAMVYHREAGYRGSEAVAFSAQFLVINNFILSKKEEEIQSRLTGLSTAAEKYFKDYDYELDREATIALLKLFYQDIQPDMLPPILKKEGAKDIQKYVNLTFSKSIFTSQERFQKWAQKPYDLSKDPVFALMRDFYISYYDLQNAVADAQLRIREADRLLMAGLMEMQPDANFYPDANFTMRLTYGSIESYSPSDAVHYDFQTDLGGVMEKEIPGNWEFDVPADLKKIYEQKEYGRYANEDNRLIVNFISTNDITGGNSGSPVIDGEGNLIGLAFDGNWEAMSGDISFEQEVQRTISMDARYLLLVIDKMANAQNIMRELKIVTE